MIRISGVTLSNPNSLSKVDVTFDILDSGMNVIKHDYFSNYSYSTIDYNEPSAGTYYVRFVDTTSTEGCELVKSIIATANFTCIADFDVNYYDSTFNVGTNLSDYGGSSIVIYNDTYIVGGFYYYYNGNNVNALIKINQNGEQYPTFTASPYLAYEIYKIVLISGGSALLYGYFSGDRQIIKINADGTQDNTFTLEYDTNVYLDGDLIKVGNNFIFGGTDSNNNIPQKLVRILPNGTIDTSFNNGGIGFAPNSIIHSIFYDNVNNKILVGGYNFSKYNNITLSNTSLLRLNIDGSLDTSFTPSIPSDHIRSITMHNGKYIVAGSYYLLRININGTIDNSFNSGGTGFIGDGIVFRVIVDNDNNIVCVGSFSTYNGVNFGGIVRLLPNGTIDTSFNNGGSGFSYGSPRDVVVDQYNRYIIVGNFYYYNDISITDNLNDISGMVRLNQNGSLNM